MTGMSAGTWLAADRFETPLGLLIAVGDEESVYALEFADPGDRRADIGRLLARTGRALRPGSTGPLASLRRELEEYFAGSRIAFDTPLSPLGTEFERSVWSTLREVPYGDTRSYRDLAAALGRPAATRAVGRANGANPLPIVVPCHRIIGSDGKLCGYGGQLWRKRWLLAHEVRSRAAAASTEAR
jgi:AraC family transcriptional regulator of adaptative response/methylated-DNA-[protein]-cysteine methyltransferase